MQYLTGIIFCAVPQVGTGNQFLKYRNIPDTEQGRKRFERFAAKFPGAQHINYYDKITKQFKERKQLHPY